MRKALLTLLAAVLTGFSAFCQEAEPDPDRYAGLDSLLTQFYGALLTEDIEARNAELDGLIGSCRDSLTRQHVTMQIFDHYQFSRVMGEEAVAVHIYDEWIATGKVKPRNDSEEVVASVFANFNRSSLLGMQAVPVTLFKPCGGKMTIPRPGKPSVIFFYSTECAKCRLEVQVLPQVMKEVDFPMDFYAVCIDSDKRLWKDFRKENFKFDNPRVKTFHLWDPESESGFEKAYGVTATPRMFVVWADGIILGRRLEVVNLQEIIHYISIGYGEETK